MKQLTFYCTLLTLFLSSHFSMATPDTVKVGVYLQNLYDFSFTDREYTADFWAWFLFKNDSIYNENTILQHIELPKNKEVNNNGVTMEKKKGYNWATINYKATMQQTWRIKNFPFDEQTLNIRLEDAEHDVRDVVYVADAKNSKYDKSIIVEGWTVKDFKVVPKTVTYETSYGDPTLDGNSQYAAVDVVIQMKRKSLGLFLKLFVGVYIAFCIAMVNLFIDATECDPRFGLPVGGLFAAVGNKYIVDSILPESPSFTLVDKIHALTFMFIFFNIIISVLSLYWMKNEQEARAKKLDRYAFIILMGLFVIINIITVTQAASAR